MSKYALGRENKINYFSETIKLMYIKLQELITT